MSRTKTGNNYDHLFRYIIVGDMGKQILYNINTLPFFFNIKL